MKYIILKYIDLKIIKIPLSGLNNVIYHDYVATQRIVV